VDSRCWNKLRNFKCRQNLNAIISTLAMAVAIGTAHTFKEKCFSNSCTSTLLEITYHGLSLHPRQTQAWIATTWQAVGNFLNVLNHKDYVQLRKLQTRHIFSLTRKCQSVFLLFHCLFCTVCMKVNSSLYHKHSSHRNRLSGKA